MQLAHLDRTGAWPPTVIVCEEVDLTGLDRKAQIAKLNEAEIRWIAQLRALGFSLLNATKGGDGSHGRPIPEEQRQKMAASNRGQKRSPQTRERQRQAALKRDPTTLLRGEAHQHFGKKIPFKDPEGRKAKLREAWASATPERRLKHSVDARRQAGTPKKLTLDQVREIYLASNSSMDTIGKRYGICREMVRKIKRGLVYHDLTGNLGK